jgi:HEPN domain-containing protein
MHKKNRGHSCPSELEERIREWVDYYINHRYHEAIDNVTPSDKYYGRDQEILKNRMKLKTQTIRKRRKINKMILLESLSNRVS